MRALLRERGFAALWLAQLITRIGDSIHEIALIWIVYEVTGDPTLITVVALASFTPGVVLSIPAGVVVDRVNRRYLLVAAEGIRGVVTLAIPFVGEGPYLIPVVVAVALIASTMETFFGPAQQAMIPRLVSPADLDAANSLNNLTLSTSRLFYALGGVIVGFGGSFLAFYINAATFLLSALVLLAIPAAAGVPEVEAGTERSSPSLLAEAREGFRFIRESPALVSVITMGVFIDFAFVPLVVVLPIFAATVVGGGSVTYGLLLGSYFAGTLVGNLLISPLRGFVNAHRGPVMVGSTMFTGLGVTLAAIVPTVAPFPLAGAALGLALAGAANPFFNVPLITYTQLSVPDEKRGKVMSVMRLGITGAAPIGIALAGPLVEAFGPVAVLLGIGAVIGIAGASGFLTPIITLGSPNVSPK
ncbi:MAG: MFS transporter [Haloferacaceae archaeon]